MISDSRQSIRSALLRVSQTTLTMNNFHARYGFRRFAKCGRVPYVGSDIDIKYSPSQQNAHFSNIIRCGSAWLCPECSSKISIKRCSELDGMIKKWTSLSDNNTVCMLTLTHSHTNNDSLLSLLNNQSKALVKFWSNGSVKRLLKSCGLVGRFTTFEITYGQGTGWHPHRHIILFMNKQSSFFELCIKLRTYWNVALQNFNLNGNSYSLDLQGATEAGKYVTKLSMEATLSNLKRSRGASERYTPFGLLSLILGSLSKPPVWAVRAFQEYAVATKGKHQFSFSKGLKAMFGIDEISDEEIAVEEPFDSVTLCSIPYSSFKLIWRNFNFYQELLEISSRGDPYLVRSWLKGKGVHYVA